MSKILSPARSVDIERRRFIGGSIAGGFVAALSSVPQAVAGQATSEECGFISKSDWLVNGLAFVGQVSNEAFSKIVKKTTDQLITYTTAFDELYCLLNALNAELAKSQMAAQSSINRIQTLAEVARTNNG